MMKQPRKIRFQGLLGVIFTLAVTACASSSDTIIERLDTTTGVTVSYARSPVMLYRDNPSLAAYARDFLHLGPIVVNRGGYKRHYLWIGTWSTMQQVDATEFRNGFENVVVIVDGEPFTLELTGWTPDTIGLSAAVYIKPIASTADAYYEVTPDQLRIIAGADEIRVHSTGNNATAYELWHDQPR